MGYVQGFRRNPDKYRYKSGMINSFFSKSIILSLLGHLTVFSIFNISFGAKLPKLDYSGINFRGAILSNLDLTGACNPVTYPLFNKSNTSVLEKINKGYALVSKDYFPVEAGSRPNWREKPSVARGFNEHKMSFSEEISLQPQVKNKPAVMFYPRLPDYFNIYFKDRQVVHIELMFNIVSNNSTNSIVIKRRISSGNLEADLLSLRYISHYLFIQETQFIPNTWQTVKIDLSTKND